MTSGGSSNPPATLRADHQVQTACRRPWGGLHPGVVGEGDVDEPGCVRVPAATKMRRCATPVSTATPESVRHGWQEALRGETHLRRIVDEFRGSEIEAILLNQRSHLQAIAEYAIISHEQTSA